MDNEFVKVPEKDKTLSPGKLFYNWFAANIGIMGCASDKNTKAHPHLWHDSISPKLVRAAVCKPCGNNHIRQDSREKAQCMAWPEISAEPTCMRQIHRPHGRFRL